MDATCVTGTAYPSKTPGFIPVVLVEFALHYLWFSVWCFAGRCLSFCPFLFGHCNVSHSSTYGVWLPLWSLQTILEIF